MLDLPHLTRSWTTVSTSQSNFFFRKGAWSLFSRSMTMKTCRSCTALGIGFIPHWRTSGIIMEKVLLSIGLLRRRTPSSLLSLPSWALLSSFASIMESTTLAVIFSSPSSTCSALRSFLRCGRERQIGTASTGAHLGNSVGSLQGIEVQYVGVGLFDAILMVSGPNTGENLD